MEENQKMRSVIKCNAGKIWLFLLTIILIFNSMPVIAAENNNLGLISSSLDSDEKNKSYYGSVRQNSYESYMEKYKNYLRPNLEIILKGASYSNSDEADIEIVDYIDGRNNVLNWNGQRGWVEWDVIIPEAGLYNIALDYYPVKATKNDIALEISIDGEIPFQETERLLFNRVWADGPEGIVKDDTGNELRPSQIETPRWIESDVCDSFGFYENPYLFYFSEGTHIIRITCLGEALAIDKIKIYNRMEEPVYTDVLMQYINNGYSETSGVMVKVQAEKPLEKSHSTLYPMYDRSGPATEPSHHSKIRYNTIGQWNWKEQGRWITWEFDVPEDGLYTITFKARQNFIRGLFSTRKLYIDGEIPFNEAKRIRFPYDTSWYMLTPESSDNNSPYLFNLSKGIHTVTLEAVTGEMSEILRKVEKILYELNYMYRKIVMITGTTPDIYRDYNLDMEIPDLLDVFKSTTQMLREVAETVDALTGKAGSEASFLKEMANQVESLINEPETIQTRLDKFKGNLSSLGTWLLKNKETPLELDYIFISSPDTEKPSPVSGFFENLLFGIKAFFASFTEKYNTIGNTYDNKNSINVWISGKGRDEAQLVRELIDSSFTPQTGIKVNLEQVENDGTLMQAIAAGKGPDVGMFIQKITPVNLAMRKVLTDLTQFDEFVEITTRFQEAAMISYDFEGGFYALPETQNFNMMFYRKDIFDELGIEVPETWDDFYNIIPIIQRNNLQIGIPEIQTIFETLIFQHDAKFYTDDRRKTGFDMPETLEAFKQWTNFYTQYSFPVAFDFYNRFRTGEMPLGIIQYTMYNYLAVTAPEIRNLWGMVPIPGIRRSDGTINRMESSDGTACIMINDTKDKDSAFEFMKWWTGEEAQIGYGNALEELLGPSARYETANINAFLNLPWSREEQNMLMTQWNEVSDIWQLPGNYYTTRNVSNAFRAVVYSWKNPRETLNKYNKYINEELLRKRVEFGLD